jgi:hypothetical protein
MGEEIQMPSVGIANFTSSQVFGMPVVALVPRDESSASPPVSAAADAPPLKLVLCHNPLRTRPASPKRGGDTADLEGMVEGLGNAAGTRWRATEAGRSASMITADTILPFIVPVRGFTFAWTRPPVSFWLSR